MKKILIVAVLITVSSAQQASCPAGWVMNTDYCYLLSHDQATWAESEAICRAFEAYLAEPDTQEVDTFITKEVVATRRKYWLGGSDIELEGKWTWVNGRRPMSYTNWIPTDPNNYNAGEDCLVANWKGDGRWADYDCEHKEYFICQMPVEFNSLIG